MENSKRVQIIGIAWAVLWAAGAWSADGGFIQVDSIRKAVQKSGAPWRVGENWVTRLSREELQRVLGMQEPLMADTEFVSPRQRSSEINSVDWRSKDGVNWVTPILNQGNCGSCVAFASVATLETQVNVTSGVPGLNPTFSPQALFACGGGACDFGWFPSAASRFLQSTGVPDEACAPYTMGATGKTVKCNSICSDSAARSTKLVSYTHPSQGSKDIDAVRKALLNGPLMTSLMVYEDFMTYQSGVYRHVTGTGLGGHAVSIVGFSDTGRYWVIRNSWGEEWGEKGFMRVSWDDISGIANDTYGFEVPHADGFVSVRNPVSRDYISGQFNLRAESSYSPLRELDLQILDSAKTVVHQFACAKSPCESIVDTTQLADGAYEALAEIKWGQGKVSSSQHVIFYIQNSEPKLNLTAAPAAGTDLGHPVSGRIVFDLEAQSGAVPMSSVVFHAFKDGKEVSTKTANIVVPGLTMGWRTNLVENGVYDAYFTGHLQVSGRDYSVESKHFRVETRN